MTERELRTVAEAIALDYGWKPDELLNNRPAYMDFVSDAQAAISASDSRYVKGLVEALKEIEKIGSPTSILASIALQNLPEDLR